LFVVCIILKNSVLCRLYWKMKGYRLFIYVRNLVSKSYGCPLTTNVLKQDTQNIWTYTGGRTILRNKGLCDSVMLPALKPQTEDPPIVGVTVLHCTFCGHCKHTWLTSTSQRLVPREGCHSQHPSEQNSRAIWLEGKCNSDRQKWIRSM
jgi:hypothetical protein